ncbi:alpha/beta fold hydrolase [Nocardia australiensis]|uniref:alpha/beta fold hydrolase n=1 Tax=Nocardia australiensis TaxID=2887191 RepID=UPI001D14C4F1|nr:alpha/beta fold hydrolase [Nocardia australiensis]
MTHVVESGSGPTLLMLHGIGGSADSFVPQFDELSSSLRLLAWDAPGYGRSADPGRPFDLDDYADAAADVIREHCGEAGAHVLGMSWGGVVATRLAMRHPDVVRSLLLGSSTVGSGADEPSAARMRSRAATLEQQGVEAFAAERSPRLLSGSASEVLVATATQIMAESIRMPGYGYAAESMATTDHTADLPKIDIPTLVLSGDEDRVTGVPASLVLAQGIPGAGFVTLRSAGHLANQERPRAFNAWVESFIHISERLRNHV